MAAGRGPHRPGGADGDPRRGGGALRHRSGDQAPPARRARRHRGHPPARRPDRGVRAGARAERPRPPRLRSRPATGTPAATTASRTRRWRWPARFWSGWSWRAARRCSTRAAARAGSPPCCSISFRRARVVAADAAPSMVEEARERFAGDPRVEVLHPVDLVELRARRARGRRVLERRLPLDPGPRRPVRPPARGAAARRAARGPVRREGQHRSFRRLADEVAAEPPYAEHMTISRAPGTTPRRRRPRSGSGAPVSRTCAAGSSPGR